SIRDQQLVRIERKPRFADRLDGFVLAVGDKWVLMARTTEGGYFDGSVFFRVKDIRRVRKDHSFEGAFARTQSGWPPSVDFAFSLDRLDSVVNGLAALGVIVGIEKDHERSAIWIGRIDEIERKTLWLHEVRPDASWHEAPRGYRLKAISTVSVASRYLNALATIAGTQPPM
ncbi:MAG: hypothetical protein KKH51_14080, partial [Actinobacteria bacterium]|nr:hypothetical protein [Actinomycetota bacterium]